jgi:hypothetical protein
MSPRFVRLLTGSLLFLGVLAPVPVSAEEPAAPGKPHSERTLYIPNALSLFLGATSSKHGTDPTLGLEYVRHLDGRVAIGLTGEVVLTSSESRGWVLALTADYVIAHRWILFFGPGVEFVDEEGHGVEREMFARFGVDYEIPLRGETLALAPSVSLDVFPHEVKWVWGVLFGVGF